MLDELLCMYYYTTILPILIILSDISVLTLNHRHSVIYCTYIYAFNNIYDGVVLRKYNILCTIQYIQYISVVDMKRQNIS